MNKAIVFMLPVAFLLTACAATIGAAELQETVDASMAKALEEQQAAAEITRSPGSGEGDASSGGSLTGGDVAGTSDSGVEEEGISRLSPALGPAPVASRSYVLIAGIPGEARDEGHKDEIDVLSWSWGLSQPGSDATDPAGGVTDPATGAVAPDGASVAVSDFSLTKYIDKASPKLYVALASREEIPEVRFTVQAQGAKKTEYLVITMTKVIVTSASNGGGGDGDRPTESITLNFAAVKVVYQELDPEGAPVGDPVEYEVQKVSHDTQMGIIRNLR